MAETVKPNGPLRRWGALAGVVAFVGLLAGLLVNGSESVSASTRAGALTLLVVGSAAAAVFLRRARLVAPLLASPGWRWLDAGSLLYIVSALACFPAAYLLVDASRLPRIAQLAGGLAITAVPLLTGPAVEPRGVEA